MSSAPPSSEPQRSPGQLLSDAEYLRMLLETAHREANLFWIRNGAMLLLQSTVSGLLIGALRGGFTEPLVSIVYVVSAIGLFFTFCHVQIVRASRYYNHSWLLAAKLWVKKRSSKDDPWQEHFLAVLNGQLDRTPRLFLHSTTIALLLSLSFAAIWLMFILATVFRDSLGLVVPGQP